jgi:hypothetical protein
MVAEVGERRPSFRRRIGGRSGGETGSRRWPGIQFECESSRSRVSPRPMTCAGLKCWSVRTEWMEHVARGWTPLGDPRGVS